MLAPSYWDLLSGYASEHHGVVSVRTAARLGVDVQQLHRLARSGRLVRAARETFVVAGSPYTWHQRAMVASLSTRGWASHRCAAALASLDGFPRREIEIVTPYGRGRCRSGWTVRRSRQIASVDRASIEGIPCTTTVRTVIDLAGVVYRPLVERALDDLCRRSPDGLELVTYRFLELTRRGRPGAALMRDLLAERHGLGRFAQTGFEDLTRDLLRRAGLPLPVPQFRVVTEGGIVVYLDLAWPAIRWAVECDSLAWHSGKRAHEWDRKRRRLLKAAGWDLAEVTYDDVTKRAAETAEQLRYLYYRRAEAVL